MKAVTALCTPATAAHAPSLSPDRNRASMAGYGGSGRDPLRVARSSVSRSAPIRTSASRRASPNPVFALPDGASASVSNSRRCRLRSTGDRFAAGKRLIRSTTSAFDAPRHSPEPSPPLLSVRRPLDPVPGGPSSSTRTVGSRSWLSSISGRSMRVGAPPSCARVAPAGPAAIANDPAARNSSRATNLPTRDRKAAGSIIARAME